MASGFRVRILTIWQTKQLDKSRIKHKNKVLAAIQPEPETLLCLLIEIEALCSSPAAYCHGDYLPSIWCSA